MRVGKEYRVDEKRVVGGQRFAFTNIADSPVYSLYSLPRSLEEKNLIKRFVVIRYKYYGQ